MSVIWMIAEQMIRQQMSAAVSSPLQTIGLGRLILYGMTAVLVLLAVVFLAVGGYAWLLTVETAPVAALVTALSLLLIAGLCLGGGMLLASVRKSKRFTAAHGDPWETVDNLIALAADEWEEPIKAYPKTAALIAGLAGVMIGDRLH